MVDARWPRGRMYRTLFARVSLAACIVSATAAGAHSGSGTFANNAPQFGDAVITGDQIDAQHASNAWDLLRRLLPRYSYIEDKSGRPLRIVGHRGRSSISVPGSDSPMVVVDGARLTSLDVLQNMPTEAIDRIEVQGGSRGT